MLVITVELYPHGDQSKARTLARAVLFNDGTLSDGSGDSELGNYQIRLQGGNKNPDLTKVWRKGNVKNFPRRKKGVWDLLYLALKNAVGERNR